MNGDGDTTFPRSFGIQAAFIPSESVFQKKYMNLPDGLEEAGEGNVPGAADKAFGRAHDEGNGVLGEGVAIQDGKVFGDMF